jgi:UDP-3-O-[3-hydroxymyristoyl] glucosamine N-acyltransferase
MRGNCFLMKVDNMSYRISEIAQWVEAKVDGDAELEINHLAKVEEAGPGDLTFISNPRYEKHIETTKASAVLVALNFPASQKTLLRCSDPYFAFMTLVQKFYGAPPQLAQGIHPTAVIDESAVIAATAAIAAHVVIGRGCRIGEHCQIHPGVVLSDGVQIGDDCLLYANSSVREKCRIGNRAIIHCGAVIGSDGFGFAFRDNRYHKIPQMGIVVIEDDVEIGANCTLDRATFGETVIRNGAKLDNLVHIAHNVEVGEHTALAAQVGIAGSTRVGKYVRFGGQVGAVGHIEMGDRVVAGGQAGITKSVPDNIFVSGYPAREHMTTKRQEAGLSKLPELIKRVRRLEDEIANLQKSMNMEDEC